jgi:hypothetical protein
MAAVAAGLLTTGLLVPLLATGAAAAGGSVTGAVFTTTVDGGKVNANIYDLKTEVYLNGGPNVPTAHRLAAGDYFFAVLAPGGQSNPNDGSDDLLSTDTVVERTFHANPDGTVSALDGSTHTFTLAGGVQLAPYKDTPNPGGEYIVAVCRYVSNGAGGAALVAPKDCKYDAFKVRENVDECTDCPTLEAPDGTKSAVPEHLRTYEWGITKSANPTYIQKLTQGTSTYMVTATKTLKDESWGVSGTISVRNPNVVDLPVTVADQGLTSATALCTVDPPADGVTYGNGSASATVPAQGSAQFSYSCAVENPGTGSYANTATIAYTDTDNSPKVVTVVSASFDFETVVETGASVTVNDSWVGTGAPAGETISANTTWTYTRIFFNANCQTYTNTATPSTGASASANVTFCGPNNGGLTMGWWQNNNGQALLKNNAGPACSTLNSYLGSNTTSAGLINVSSKPTDLYKPASCAPATPTYLPTFTYNVIKAANAAGSGQAMLLGQWLTTALDTAAYPSATSAGKPTLQSGQKVANPANLLGVGTCTKVGDLLSEAVSQFGSYKADKAKVTGLATLFDNINNNRAQTCQP